MTKLFNLINSECQFAVELIDYGITQIRKADLQRKGLYYQAFTNLSVGLERVLKLIIIFDNFLKTGALHTQNQLKQMGHNLSDLYKKCVIIGEEYRVQKEFSEPDEVYENLIKILSDFANTGNDNRYFNLNYISEVNAPGFELPKDATFKWYEQIDGYIYDHKISDKKKMKFENENRVFGQMLNGGASINFSSETNAEIDNGVDFCFNKNRQILCQPYRVLFVAHIVRYLSNILNETAYKLQTSGVQDIPYVNEYFRVYRCEDSFLLKKCRFIR